MNQFMLIRNVRSLCPYIVGIRDLSDAARTMKADIRDVREAIDAGGRYDTPTMCLIKSTDSQLRTLRKA